MWPRKTLDIGFCDLFRGLSYAVIELLSRTNKRPANRSRTSNEDGRFVCLSVRSGFDTLLRSLDFPTGSEVLFSELTIPDMQRIVSANGIQAIGVGLDPESWSIDLSLLEDVITPQTRAIVVTQLFGRRDSLSELAKIARRHGLLLIEDCAQSFRGPRDRGDPHADVSMFSFGPIKTNTCLGGAILRLRNPEIVARFSIQHQQLPTQTNAWFAKRLLKYLVLKCFNNPLAYGMLYRALAVLGRDPDATISGLARGFAGSDFLSRIRKRPSASLTRLIESRLSRDQAERRQRRCSRGRELTSLLSPAIETPAHLTSPDDAEQGYWVYPVLSRCPQSLQAELVQHDFDATRRSSLAVIANRSETKTSGADFLERVVFLPLENQMKRQDLERLAKIVNSHEQRYVDDREKPAAFWGSRRAKRHQESELSKT